MPQFSERKKLILTFLVINCGMYLLNENEALKYIKHNFGSAISRRTYYNYRNTVFKSYEKSLLDNYQKDYPGLSIHHDISRSNKGLTSMALMTERIAIIRRGLKMGIKLLKYDRPINVPSIYQTDYDKQTKILLNKSKKLIARIRSKTKNKT
ncbi:MAG: hypothetical protein P0116_16135 [Candidatus Nitrosocosmicus sp.]|nr:hypothetical protein [Candidatus Nitrosocosmicus sp.]